jgi:hypothetical protein
MYSGGLLAEIDYSPVAMWRCRAVEKKDDFMIQPQGKKIEKNPVALAVWVQAGCPVREKCISDNHG